MVLSVMRGPTHTKPKTTGKAKSIMSTFYSSKRGAEDEEEKREEEEEEEDEEAEVKANTLALPHYGSIETNTVVVDVEIERQNPFHRDYNDAVQSSLIGTIPPEITLLSDLLYLTLSHNSMGIEGPFRVPQRAIRFLRALERVQS